MLTGFPLADEQKNMFLRILEAMRWNQYGQYKANWPIVLKALRYLWEMGKITRLDTPFFEPFEKPKAG